VEMCETVMTALWMPEATLNATTGTDHCNTKLATVPLGETVALCGLIKTLIWS
jgi:hypothetical protein